MKKLWEKIGTLMAAVAFAEEGEAETAREMLAEADADSPGDEQKPLRRPPRLVPTHAKASGA